MIMLVGTIDNNFKAIKTVKGVVSMDNQNEQMISSRVNVTD
jgi:hypothetical protein